MDVTGRENDVAVDEPSAVAPDHARLPRWFLGIPFTPLTLRETAERVVARSPNAPFVFVTTPNAQHVVRTAAGDRRFLTAHDRGWLVVNDSSILSLLSARWFGQPLPKAAGSDLTALLFREYIRSNDAITVIGGSDEVECRLRSQFGLSTLARHNPPMGFYNNPVEIERCVEFILAHPARYVFLAVGAPQSEMVACRTLERGGAVGTALCIGSSLHFVTGVVRRAPEIFQRAHLEWAYRLAQNPRRHLRRVFVESLPVLWIAWTYRVTPSLASHQRRGSG
jgi:N-acetylglucosaminyldiphosphoundecaprenol N-acetyl-beta-D-mannosaminyltransferase